MTQDNAIALGPYSGGRGVGVGLSSKGIQMKKLLLRTQLASPAFQISDKLAKNVVKVGKHLN